MKHDLLVVVLPQEITQHFETFVGIDTAEDGDVESPALVGCRSRLRGVRLIV